MNLNVSGLRVVTIKREEAMARDLGKTKDGHDILARGVAEDNSGIVYQHPDGQYVVACAYPIDMLFIDGQEIEVYDQMFLDKDAAIAALYNYIGYEKSYGQ